jgi:hypothetical protein
MRARGEDSWVSVESSAVLAVRYSTAKSALDVCFEEGRKYRYFEVPRSKYRALLKADSIGAFVNRQIKPFHPCIEITPMHGTKNSR